MVNKKPIRKERSDKGKKRKDPTSRIHLEANISAVDDRSIDALNYASEVLRGKEFRTQRLFIIDAILAHKERAYKGQYLAPISTMQLTAEMYNILDRIAWLVNNAGSVDPQIRAAATQEITDLRGEMIKYAASSTEVGRFDDE